MVCWLPPITDVASMIIGENYYFTITYKNSWAKANNVNITLDFANNFDFLENYMTIHNSVSNNFEINTDEEITIGEFSTDIIGFTLDRHIQSFEDIRFQIVLTYNNGIDFNDITTYSLRKNCVISNSDIREEVVPTNSPIPNASETPVVTATPTVSESPLVTAIPTVSESPLVTTTPIVTISPIVTTIPSATESPTVTKIGRASCRERVSSPV